jgi:hypothetical protein
MGIVRARTHFHTVVRFVMHTLVSSPLPHLVVAIPPTASAIVVVVVIVIVAVVTVVVVAYYPPLCLGCLIVVCTCPCPSSCRLPVAPPPPLHFALFVDS